MAFLIVFKLLLFHNSMVSYCLRKRGYCLGWRQFLFASYFKLMYMYNQLFLIYIIEIYK